MPRRSDLRNGGDVWLSSNEAERLKSPPIEIKNSQDLVRFLGNHEKDIRRSLQQMERLTISSDRMAKDLTLTYLVADAIVKGAGNKDGIPGLGWDDLENIDNSKLAATIALALKKDDKPLVQTPVAAMAPIHFEIESTAFTASTAKYVGADGVPGTQAAAGTKGSLPRTFTRVQLNTGTAIAASGTVTLTVYSTPDGVNFTAIGSVTFTGDGTRKCFDTRASTMAIVFAPISDTAVLNALGQGLVYGPQVQIGVSFSADITTKGCVTLF